MQIFQKVITFSLCVATFSAQTAPKSEAQDTADEQTAYCPNTHKLGATPSAQYWLEGFVGSKAVRMFLNRGGSGVVGLFYEPGGDWTPILLGGMWKLDSVDLTAGKDIAAFDRETQAPIGRLQGKLSNKVLIGKWLPKGSEQAEPVRLSVIPKMGCEAKGAWKHFESQKWPYSFSYPASWKLVEEKSGRDSYIRLMCPDPEALAYDADVTIDEGAGDPTEESGVVRCGDSWRFKVDCDEDIKDHASAYSPKESTRHGLKILDISEREWRGSCRSGGYIGQTEGIDQVVLLRDGWFRITGPEDGIVAHIVDTIRPHSSK